MASIRSGNGFFDNSASIIKVLTALAGSICRLDPPLPAFTVLKSTFRKIDLITGIFLGISESLKSRSGSNFWNSGSLAVHTNINTDRKIEDNDFNKILFIVYS